jgi:hypothetical protein
MFGLLSMHGWGTHAGMHPVGTAPDGVNTMVGMAEAGAHGHEGRTANVVDEPLVGPTHRTTGHGDGPGNDAVGMLALCLAVLGGLLWCLTLFLLRRGIPTLRTLLPVWTRPAFPRRDRDPPDLLLLCMIRC